MLFSRMTFLLIFLPLVLGIYYASPKYMKNTILLCGSFLFFAWGEPLYIFVMLFFIGLAYFQGLFLRKFIKLGQEKKAKRTLIIGIIVNVGILILFKYLGFIIDSFNHLTGSSLEFPKLPIPLGISFFVLQILSYLFDVYRGDAKAQENPMDLALYIVMFPKLIAGPIAKYRNLEIQINYRDESIEKFAIGVRRFIIGLGKRVVFAGLIGNVFTELSTISSYDNSIILAWVCSIAFTLEIYFTLSGYADMAIGLGKMFSFDLPENFNYPYSSRSITEFWQRWQITLINWFKDYVYNPMSNKKHKIARRIINVLIVVVLIGLWQGASWNLLIYGIINGLLLIIEKKLIGKYLAKLPRIIGKIYTLFIVNLSFIWLAYDGFLEVIESLKNMFGLNHLPIWNQTTDYVLLSYGFIFIVLCMATSPLITVFVTTFMRTTSKTTHNFEVVRCIVEPLFFLVIMILVIVFLAVGSVNPLTYIGF